MIFNFNFFLTGLAGAFTNVDLSYENLVAEKVAYKAVVILSQSDIDFTLLFQVFPWDYVSQIIPYDLLDGHHRIEPE
jgi:hypothetical protein